MSPQSSAQRILLVDDEPRIREVVAGYLRRDGYLVETAEDGEAARRGLSEFQPDLVVLDLMLPAVSGFEVLSEIRRSGDLPVIVLTARAEETDRVAGLELGADDYVVKPFSPGSWWPGCEPCCVGLGRKHPPGQSNTTES